MGPLKLFCALTGGLSHDCSPIVSFVSEGRGEERPSSPSSEGGAGLQSSLLWTISILSSFQGLLPQETMWRWGESWREWPFGGGSKPVGAVGGWTGSSEDTKLFLRSPALGQKHSCVQVMPPETAPPGTLRESSESPGGPRKTWPSPSSGAHGCSCRRPPGSGCPPLPAPPPHPQPAGASPAVRPFNS